MDVRCKIELLGWLRVYQDERVISRFPTRQTAALLAYLAFYRHRSHPRDLRMELLWPEDPPGTDRHKLRKALTSLRHQLEPPGVPAGAVIIATRDCVQLNPAAVTTDVAALEIALKDAGRARSELERARSLEAAVDLYRGELLSGWYDGWIIPERQRLAELYLEALEWLVRHFGQAGELRRALDHARRAVAADPLREEAQHELIRLLAAAGQAEAARQQYHEFERLLERELAAAPSPEIQRLLVDLDRSSRSTSSAMGVPGLETWTRTGAREAPRGEEVQGLAVGALGMATTASGIPAVSAERPAPTGTVTFLLVDLVDGAGERIAPALRSLLRGHGGHECPMAGVFLAAAFGRATDALAAAVAGQRTVREHGALRIALHTGEVPPGDPPQRSPALAHAARLLAAAHPGQILLSSQSAVLLQEELPSGLQLADRGRYRLRDSAEPEVLFELQDAGPGRREFPPPRAAPEHAGHLPLQLTRFSGEWRSSSSWKSWCEGSSGAW